MLTGTMKNIAVFLVMIFQPDYLNILKFLVYYLITFIIPRWPLYLQTYHSLDEITDIQFEKLW